MYLETLDRRSLFLSRHSREFLPARRRPARTSPSTFLFLPIHLSNSPRPESLYPSGTPEGRRGSMHPITVGCVFHCTSEELGAVRHRAVSGRRRRWPVYRLQRRRMSTGNLRFSFAPRRPFGRPPRRAKSPIGSSLPGGAARPRAALRPYSCSVLRPQFSREVNARGGSSAAVGPKPAYRLLQAFAAAIDGSAASLHRPLGTIQQGLASGLLSVAGSLLRSQGAGGRPV